MLELKRRVLLDVEANSLDNVTKIWCIVCKDIDTLEVFKFRPNTPLTGHKDFENEFIAFTKTCSLFIGHNILGYDRPWINHCFNGDIIGLDQCLDTLVLSRLFRPTPAFDRYEGDNRQGGHSLAAWGYRLGFHKKEFSEFDKFSEQMLEYCVNDVLLLEKVYHALMQEKKGFSELSIILEHKTADMLRVQERNGFFLNQTYANKLLSDTTNLLKEMDVELQELFPPVFKLVRNLTPKVNKDGILSKVSERILNDYRSNSDLKAEAQEDGSFNLSCKETFNPQSPQQVASRLLTIGWKPKNYTEKGNIKTDKVTIADALKELLQDNPKLEPLRCLQDYNIVADRNQKVLKWLDLASKDGKVHGRVNPIGASTHRCSHYDDNMANIARVVGGKLPKAEFYNRFDNTYSLTKFCYFDNSTKVFLKANDKEVEFALIGLKGAFGWDSRNCWSVEDTVKYRLIGFDAAGIQLRALAHYMNDHEYTKQLLEGDIHEVNRVAAGISTRAKAKTFIYAWLLGAGDEKIGTIVGCTEAEWEDLFEFARNRKKWKSTLLKYVTSKLREQGRKADKKTVATIIKGFKTKEDFLNRLPALKRFRLEEIPQAAKKGYILGLDGRKIWVPNEHLTMGAYLQGFEAVIMKQAMLNYQTQLLNSSIPFWQCAFVHDEMQVKALTEHADIVGQAGVQGIRDAGELFKVNCPLDGEYKVGLTWAETH